MFNNRADCCRLAGLTAVAVVMASLSPLAVDELAVTQPDQAHAGWVLTAPKRRAADPAPAPPPPLPAGAQSVRPATFEILIRRGSESKTQVLRQSVSRTSERIHLTGKDGREWLFERNPIDPRRVSATMVEHSSKAIVLYEETDLRMALGIRGWADIFALGFDSQTLNRYQRTREKQSLGGVSFVRYVRNAPSSTAGDVWWSDEQVFPSQFTFGDGAGRMRFTIEHLRAGVDMSVLRPALARFPQYRVIDLSDWLEKH